MLSASQGWPEISWDGSKQESSIQKTDTNCCHILTHHESPPGTGSLQNCIERANIAATTMLLAGTQGRDAQVIPSTLSSASV